MLSGSAEYQHCHFFYTSKIITFVGYNFDFVWEYSIKA